MLAGVVRRGLHLTARSSDTDKNLRQGWGGEDGKRELAAEQNAVADAAAEGAAATAEAAAQPAIANGDDAAAGAAAPAVAPVPEEEEDNTKTYDDYLAEQKAKRAQLSAAAKPLREAETDDSSLGQKVVKGEGNTDFWAAKEKVSRVYGRCLCGACSAALWAHACRAWRGRAWLARRR